MTTILTKKKDTAGAPVAGDLTNAAGGAELAVNTATKRLYTKDSGGNVVEIGTNPSSLDVPVVISGTTTDAALRVTQLGTGNALLVEDSSNPDSTPFVITADGRIVSGATSLYPSPVNNANTDKLQLNGANTYDSSADFISWATGTDTGTSLNLARSDSGTIGTHTVVGSADIFGNVRFFGSDGTNFLEGAKISAGADGTPGTNDMPGRLTFSTTADGASSSIEAMRITSAQNVSIGTSAAVAGTTLRLSKSITGAVASYAILNNGTIQSDVTTSANIFTYNVSTVASASTLATLRHFYANQGTVVATSAITNQYGFFAESGMTGATNNYGFYGDIASGTGRYNLYMSGTASNYLGGNTIISVTDNTNAALRITQLGTGNALLVEDSTNPDSTPFVIDATGAVIVGYTATVGTQNYTGTALTNTLYQQHGTAQSTSTAAIFNWSSSAGSPANLILNKSISGTNGTRGALTATGTDLGSVTFNGDDGTNFIPAALILAETDGTPGTNDMPGRLIFSTTADGASTPTERMRIDSDGDVGIGTATPTSGLQTAGSSSKSAFKTPNIAEVNTISATAATGTINYDITTQSVLYYTTNASGNFTVNFRGSSGTTLNTVMQTGESISATFLVTNGATAYYNSAVQVDGSSVTPKWQGGTAPTSGNASSIDSYTYVIIKTGSAAFTVLASVTKFA